MNPSHLLTGLLLWGSVFTMGSALYTFWKIHFQNNRRAFFLGLLQANVSLVLLCSAAGNLCLASSAPDGSLYLALRLFLVYLRSQMAVLAACYIRALLPGQDLSRLYLTGSAIGSITAALIQGALIWRDALQGAAPAFLEGNYHFAVSARMIFLVCSLLVLLVSEKELVPAYYRAVMIFLLPPLLTSLLCFSIQGYLAAIDLSCSISSVAMYVILLRHTQRLTMEQEEKILAERTRLARQKEEMNLLENQLILSQLQPEFLKESLATISRLCDTDTEAARRGVSWFSDYLRENMDSLKKTEPVPFQTHLAHIQNFLNLERLNFGDRLQSCFDFETVDFSIPSLCIQPLLENAIRYGITPAGSGCVTLRTRREEGQVLIEIEDDGAGFSYREDLDQAGAYPGIRAIRSRILSLSGGSLEIASTPGKGTLARIRIPDSREKTG